MTLRNTFFYITGIGFLVLAKVKNILTGYSSPKPFNTSETERCIEYDINVAENWLTHLQEFLHCTNNSLAGKNILELGPGSDLGIGIYLLSKGCSQYNACDVYDCMKSATDSFYEQFFKKLENLKSRETTDSLKELLKETKAGNPSKLNYVVSKDFDIVSAFGESTIDLVFSQAAFEHFDDFEATISQLSTVCKSGAVLVAEIDLKTHSRWIRVKDPNNIYRYPHWIYKSFWFRGIPRRVRPFQYKEAFERNGWTDISIAPLEILGDVISSYSGMDKNFSDNKNQMNYLSIMLCARNSKSGQTEPLVLE